MVATLGWVGWTAYAYRSAISQAKALGWYIEHTDPVERIRKNWKSAFEKVTWLDGVKRLYIPTSQQFEQHLDIVHRLDPMELHIRNAATLRDLSALIPLKRLKYVSVVGATGLTSVDALKSLIALQVVWLDGCTGLTNVDALKSLFALTHVRLDDCTGLTNVDALKGLPALKWVDLTGCTGLSPETVAALKAALPKATITGP
jgi:hypothetical protein